MINSSLIFKYELAPLLFMKSFLKEIFKRTKNEEVTLLNQTLFTFILGLLSFFILFNYGFQSLYQGRFELLYFIECFFAFIGVFFLWNSNIEVQKNVNKVQVFRKIKKISFCRALVILVIIGCFGVLLRCFFVYFSNIDLYFYIILCAPSEELFFRGFLLSKFKNIYYYNPLSIKVGKNKTISLTSIFSILISSSLFTIIHINYYDDTEMLIQILIGGILLGWLYWSTDDLTACVFAHLFINIATGWKLL